MRKLRIIKGILERTHTANILVGYFFFVFISAFIIQVTDPTIQSYGDALWYCYAVISTAGFGDIVTATFAGKIISVILTIYSVLVIALVTGVIVNYYNEVLHIYQEETLAAFMDRLEQLPDLSREELLQLSEKVKLFRPDWKKKKQEKKKADVPVVFMNMCMIRDRDNRVVALDKTGDDYSGITFPGGHVEQGETFTESVIREVYEETGLTVGNPVLRGIYHWYRSGAHCVGLLYRADEFEGELRNSDEGNVYWIPREEYEKLDLARGMHSVLEIMDRDEISECFMDLKDDGSVTERLS